MAKPTRRKRIAKAEKSSGRCIHCNFPPAAHRRANYADMSVIGEAFGVCPTAVYHRAKARGEA